MVLVGSVNNIAFKHWSRFRSLPCADRKESPTGHSSSLNSASRSTTACCTTIQTTHSASECWMEAVLTQVERGECSKRRRDCKTKISFLQRPLSRSDKLCSGELWCSDQPWASFAFVKTGRSDGEAGCRRKKSRERRKERSMMTNQLITSLIRLILCTMTSKPLNSNPLITNELTISFDHSF